eukprot:scaffold10230_cov150-Amphora_coffeaeformis.AAC.6
MAVLLWKRPKRNDCSSMTLKVHVITLIARKIATFKSENLPHRRIARHSFGTSRRYFMRPRRPCPTSLPNATPST